MPPFKTEHLFAYPDLEPEERLEVERTVDPFGLEPAQLNHLLSTRFPFDVRTRSWLERYLELSEIHRQQGPLPTLEITMSRWASNQRKNRNLGLLSPARERALNRIGFAWNVNQAVWQKQYEDYLEYKRVPKATMGKGLCTWVCSMRDKWERLTPRQKRLLEEAGVVQHPFAEKVESALVELEALYDRQGHVQGLGKKLHKAVSRLRYRYKTGKLDPEIQKRCDKIGLKWIPRPKPAELWLIFYDRVSAYVQHADHGGPPPPVWKWPDRALSLWVGRQTSHWNQLSDEQKQLLQKLQIGPEKEHNEALWNRRYGQAMAIYGRLGPYRKHVYQNEDRLLKRWLRNQRHKWDILNEDQRTRLEAIGLHP